MSWRAVLADTTTGLLAEPIGIPSASWSVSISDSSLSTTRDKGTGADDATGVHVPWSAVPASTQEGRERALASLRRSLLLAWDDGDETWPVVYGAIGYRTDTWADTSFDLVSPMDLLAQRYLVREGRFGADQAWTKRDVDGHETDVLNRGTTSDSIHWSGLSLRAIACRAVRLATQKPGGYLPIDLPYVDERGGHERTYDGFDVRNLSVASVLQKISNVAGGPDIQLRPYMADQSHVRLLLEAGSDSEPYLRTSGLLPTLVASSRGGNVRDLEVAYQGPVMRVYSTGSGQDKAQLCHLSEDLALCRQGVDPWPLVEESASFSDDDTQEVLAGHSDARLDALRRPVMQARIGVELGAGFDFARFWPGREFDLVLDGFPSLPDGTYRMRLMEMSGDLGTSVKLVADVTENPWYAR